MHKRREKLLSKIFKILYYIVISFVCLIAFILLYYVISSQINSKKENYYPKISFYTIVSPSMTPVIEVYDVVVNIRVSNPEDIKVGDIITYVSSSSTSEGMTITHRVVQIKKDEDGNITYLTQGDNNSNPDSLYVEFDKVIGKEIIIIPKLGKIQFLIANKKTWLYLLLIPIFIFIIRDLYKLIDLLTLKKRVELITNEEKDEIDHEKQQKLKEQLIEMRNEKPEPVDYKKTIKPKIIESEIEILDTDELTSKIKEYDKKIKELDEAIKEYKPPTKQEEIVEEENFLIGKQKVISTVDTKNKKKFNKDIYKEEPKIEKKTEVKVENKQPTKKHKLNLNPKQVSQVTKNKKQQNNQKNKLNLNPKHIKTINRPGRQRSRKRTGAIREQKQRLIEIRKRDS